MPPPVIWIVLPFTMSNWRITIALAAGFWLVCTSTILFETVAELEAARSLIVKLRARSAKRRPRKR